MTEAGWTVCIECGMMCEAVEYHPYAACLMFKQCLNSETVRANLQAVRDDSYQQGRVEVNVDALVDRFLAWPLPASVCSDLCATKQGYPHRSGTNLLSAVEAKAMLEYVLGIAQQAQGGV